MSDLKFSEQLFEEGTHRLAVASHDNSIVVYGIDPEQFKIVSVQVMRCDSTRLQGIITLTLRTPPPLTHNLPALLVSG